jgi:hypothetical protein
MRIELSTLCLLADDVALEPYPQPFLFSYFFSNSLFFFALELASDHNPPTYASCTAVIKVAWLHTQLVS